jgi:hypothetical protein
MMDHDIRLGRIASFAEIVEREAQDEQHICLFAPLTFLWPCIIPAIGDYTAPADLTVTGLAKALPYSRPSRSAQSHETPRLIEPLGKIGVQ